MNEVFEFLNGIYPLSPGCIEHLAQIIKTKKAAKKEVLLEMGEVNRHLYFIVKGVLHCYYYVEDTPVSDWFFWESDTVVSIGSFYDQLPSEDYIVALEECELLYITKTEYDYLTRTFLEFNYIARFLLEKYLKIFHAHARFIRKTAPVMRYQMVLDKMPKLIQRIPLAALASWLNMEPETLSRVRSRRD